MDEIRKCLTTSRMGGSRINSGSYSAGQRDGYRFGRGDRLEGQDLPFPVECRCGYCAGSAGSCPSGAL